MIFRKCKLSFLVITIITLKLNFQSTLSYQKTMFATNVSQTLNNLLHNYDKHLRPDFGMKATVIKIDINIRSMGPVSEQNMVYSFDCYFRQTWQDKRLSFEAIGNVSKLQLNERMLSLIWRPDTFFYNGRGSHLHNITSPNVLFRIGTNGEMLLSMRLTIKARCPMHLQKFPMDKQLCPLIVGSHAYTMQEVVYKWKKGQGNSIEKAQDLKMSQFDLKGMQQSHDTFTIGTRGNFSMLVVHFELERNMGYFLIQIYVPCSLLVVLSWVGFWINREATSDRIALGITTVLTMVFLGMDNRQDLPRVSYSTALDIYVGICFSFVMATIIQFAAVHYFTKHGSGELHLILESDEEENIEEEETPVDKAKSRNKVYSISRTNGGLTPTKGFKVNPSLPRAYSIASGMPEAQNRLAAGGGGGLNNRPTKIFTQQSYSQDSLLNAATESSCIGVSLSYQLISEHPDQTKEEEEEEVVKHSNRIPLETDQEAKSSSSLSEEGHDNCIIAFLNCIKGSSRYKSERLRKSKKELNSVSKIDTISRIGFPLAFITFNIIYWIFYLQFM